ncbi:helix-turn-helix domain-containing protein [Pseudochrobactrum lubricantis]|uniref:helix-turn-helix domain-containing protein n=1 Tax=Pseudochrobactrum lubricantis TaxID=558172 RepID=UPI0035DF8E83
MKTEVDFGCRGSSVENVSIYRGMNPKLVRRVWAERRRAEAKAKLAMVTKKSAPRIKDTVDAAPMPEVYEAAQQAIGMGFDSVKQAREIVAYLYEIPVEQMNAKTRQHRISKARHAAICAIKLRWPETSLPFLAKHFDVDHTTILYALKKQGIETANPALAA